MKARQKFKESLLRDLYLTKNRIVVFLILIGFTPILAQTELNRWSKANNYLIDNSIEKKEVDFNYDNESINLASIFVNIYKVSFSDFDGDNCSFNPSCSEFFVQSTKMANPFISILLFFDRLIRDTNIFSKQGYKIINNRYYDPPTDYISNTK